MAKRTPKADLLKEATRRIRDMSDHDWHIAAVLYLGIKPEEAAEIRRWAQETGKARE